MKIKNKKNINKKLAITLILLLMVLVYTITAYQFKVWPFKSVVKINLSPTTSEQKKVADQIKSNSINKTDDNSKTTNPDQPLPPVKNPEVDTYTIPVDITSSNQDGSMLKIRVLIQTLLASGNCKITMTKGNKIYKSTAETQALPSTSTCKGFDIPTSELEAGIWATKFDVSSDNIFGQATKNIEVR